MTRFRAKVRPADDDHETYPRMPQTSALVINLSSARTRMAEMARQLNALGVAFERVEATTPPSLSIPLDAPYWQRSFLPMTDTEKALFESHRRCWQRCLDQARAYLIFEDDAMLSHGLAPALQRWGASTDLDYLNIETAFGAKYVGRQVHDGLRDLHEDDLGLGAYILWPSGAAKLLDLASRFCAPADLFVPCCTQLIKAQADPALSVQALFHQRAGVATHIAVDSQLTRAEPRQSSLQQRLHRQFVKWRRVIRKRQHRGKFERLVIEFDRDNRI